MKRHLWRAAWISLLTLSALLLFKPLLSPKEPVYAGYRITSWLNDISGVPLKVIETPQWTEVYLANLSDDEVFRLKPWKPKVLFVPRNMAAFRCFYTNKWL